jgi:phage shock protein A
MKTNIKFNDRINEKVIDFGKERNLTKDEIENEVIELDKLDLLLTETENEIRELRKRMKKVNLPRSDRHLSTVGNKMDSLTIGDLNQAFDKYEKLIEEFKDQANYTYEGMWFSK